MAKDVFLDEDGKLYTTYGERVGTGSIIDLVSLPGDHGPYEVEPLTAAPIDGAVVEVPDVDQTVYISAKAEVWHSEASAFPGLLLASTGVGPSGYIDADWKYAGLAGLGAPVKLWAYLPPHSGGLYQVYAYSLNPGEVTVSDLVVAAELR